MKEVQYANTNNNHVTCNKVYVLLCRRFVSCTIYLESVVFRRGLYDHNSTINNHIMLPILVFSPVYQNIYACCIHITLKTLSRREIYSQR